MAVLPRSFRTARYRWVIAVTGIPVMMSAIGLGRLAFGIELPGMQAGMHLTAAQMGAIGTANFAGYLASVLFAPFLVRRFRPRASVVLGLIVVGLSLAAMGRSQSFLSLATAFTITGLGTGFANIGMMALLPSWFANNERGKATGIVLWGNSAGIILAGVLVPRFNHIYGEEGWRAGWLALGLIGLASAVVSGLLLRNSPRELGLEPVSSAPLSAGGNHGTLSHRGGRGALARLSLVYMAFSLTTSVYSAFIVFSMIHEYGLSGPTAGFYWSWMGICSFFSGVGFGSLSDRIGRRHGLAFVFAVYTASYLLAGLKLGPAALFVSVVLYGLSIFGSVAIVTAAVGDYFETSSVAHALSLATMVYAVGQTVGPIAAGAIATSQGLFTRVYLISALVTAAAALFAFTLPAKHR